jgi:hypothetical protein
MSLTKFQTIFLISEKQIQETPFSILTHINTYTCVIYFQNHKQQVPKTSHYVSRLIVILHVTIVAYVIILR